MNDLQATKPEIDDLAPPPGSARVPSTLRSTATEDGLASPSELFPPEPAEIAPPNQHEQKQKSHATGSPFDVFPSLRALKDICDYIGASREELPAGYRWLASPWFLGFWWALLAGLILLFCGQTSKFIYIDF